jgi:hypothetical protein
MSDYINIKGQNIEVVASDPSNPTIGQIWYNTVSNTLEGFLVQADAWTSGGNLNTPGLGDGTFWGTGGSTAFGRAGGRGPEPGTPAQFGTEEYNGSTWTNVPATISPARRGGRGIGTLTTGIIFGGYSDPSGQYLSNAQAYDGSSWTSSPSIPAVSFVGATVGSSTAGLLMGGGNQTGYQNFSAEYDGSTWTAGPNMSTAKSSMAGFGIQTAAISAGGYFTPNPAPPGGTTDQVENYDGSSWTSLSNFPISQSPGGGAGTQTAGLVINAGGPPGPPNKNTYKYDGTTFTASSALSANSIGASGGVASADNAIGNYSPAPTYLIGTEEFTNAGPTTKTITAS